MVRLKHRVKLDYLTLTPRSSTQLASSPEAEADVVDTKRVEERDARGEPYLEGTANMVETVLATDHHQTPPAPAPKQEMEVTQSRFPMKSRKSRIVLDESLIKRRSKTLTPPPESDVVDGAAVRASRREELINVESSLGESQEGSPKTESILEETQHEIYIPPTLQIRKGAPPKSRCRIELPGHTEIKRLRTLPPSLEAGSFNIPEYSTEAERILKGNEDENHVAPSSTTREGASFKSDGHTCNKSITESNLDLEQQMQCTPTGSRTTFNILKQENNKQREASGGQKSRSEIEILHTPIGLRKIKLGTSTPSPDEEDREDDITGSVLELAQDEISTPKGPRKSKLQKSPDFSHNPCWIKPENLLEEMWEKKRTLRLDSDKAEDFVFPTDPEIVLTPHVWQLKELMKLKTELNDVKSSLDRFPLEHWHSHTKNMNIANSIMSHVKRYFNPEFSSQAWGKMFEILCAYDVIPGKVLAELDAIREDQKKIGDKVPFDSVHLCEAPGAFISALNHFLKISYPEIDWNWLATTLNPYHESNDVGKMINDDRLILMSHKKWTFLEDKTGNILYLPNLKYLITEKENKLDKIRNEKKGTKESKVLLVTADGSIDCQTNPSEQEAMVTHLQFGEIVTALDILQEGGSFVLKIFTFLEAATICHLYLLSCVFKQVHLFKPATSKEGNSEVYVICLEYLGKKSIESILDTKLRPNLEKYDKLLGEGKLLLPYTAIPEFFIKRIKEAAQFFCNYQMKIIRRNTSCFPCDSRMYLVMKPFRKEAAELWIEWSEIQALSTNQRLFLGNADDFKMNKACHLDIKKEIGCFMDKLLRKDGTDMQKLEAIKLELLSYENDWRGPSNQVIYGSVFKVGPINFERPYKNIRCSRFCYGRVLTSREEIREIVNAYLGDLQAHGLGTMDNICSGHAIKRVYESMSKSCDVKQTDLEVLCFSKLTWDYVTKTDFQMQKEDLNRLYEAVVDTGKDRSLFLCRFPMLSRLQTGFIFCLASVFEKIIMYVDPTKNVIGIMLHKFKGLSKPEDKNMFRCLRDILTVLKDDEFNWPVLQAVSMKTLLECMPTEFLVKYNILLLCQDMLRTVNVVEHMIKSNFIQKSHRTPMSVE